MLKQNPEILIPLIKKLEAYVSLKDKNKQRGFKILYRMANSPFSKSFQFSFSNLDRL